MQNLTKKAINAHIANQCSLKHNQATKLVNAFFNLLSEFLISSHTIKLSKFGSFKVKLKKKRLGRNPKNLEVAIIPAKKVIVFKSTKILIKAINTGKDI